MNKRKVIVGSMLLGIALICVYLLISPSIALKKITNCIEQDDVYCISSYIDNERIQNSLNDPIFDHFRNALPSEDDEDIYPRAIIQIGTLEIFVRKLSDDKNVMSMLRGINLQDDKLSSILSNQKPTIEWSYVAFNRIEAEIFTNNRSERIYFEMERRLGYGWQITKIAFPVGDHRQNIEADYSSVFYSEPWEIYAERVQYITSKNIQDIDWDMECSGPLFDYYCNDNRTGNSYQIKRHKNILKVYGENVLKGTSWNQTSTRHGDISFIKGINENGFNWSSLIIHYSDNVFTYSINSEEYVYESGYCIYGVCRDILD